MHKQQLLHHLAVGLGFIWLMACFYLGKVSGLLDWGTAQAPAGYKGVGLMLTISMMMLPVFFIWSRYMRWVEKRMGDKKTTNQQTE